MLNDDESISYMEGLGLPLEGCQTARASCSSVPSRNAESRKDTVSMRAPSEDGSGPGPHPHRYRRAVPARGERQEAAESFRLFGRSLAA